MTKDRLLKRIDEHDFVVGYAPFRDEVDYKTLVLNGKQCVPDVIVPYDRNIDPFVFAHACMDMSRGRHTCILVPGVSFDKYGNKKGRGDGWFDRFLSRVPRTWLRVGVCERSQLSEDKLKTQVWDEPVDGIVVYDSQTATWEITETMSEYHIYI